MDFSPKWSDAQKDAIVREYVGKVRAREVRDLAAAGALTDAAGEPLPAFRIPVDTIRSIRNKARQRDPSLRALTSDPVTDESSERLARLVKDKIQELEQRKSNGETINPGELEALTRADRNVRATMKAQKAATPPQAPSDGHQKLAHELLEDHRANPQPIPPAPEPIPGQTSILEQLADTPGETPGEYARRVGHAILNAEPKPEPEPSSTVGIDAAGEDDDSACPPHKRRRQPRRRFWDPNEVY